MLDFEDGILLSRLGVTDVLCAELLLVSTLPNGFPELSYCLYAAATFLWILFYLVGVLEEVWLRYICVCLVGVVDSSLFSLDTSPAVFLYYLRKSVIWIVALVAVSKYGRYRWLLIGRISYIRSLNRFESVNLFHADKINRHKEACLITDFYRKIEFY